MQQFFSYSIYRLPCLSAVCFVLAVNFFATFNANAQSPWAFTRPTVSGLSFQFQDLNGQLFTELSLPREKPYTTIIFYDPDCPHCTAQAKQIAANFHRFNNTELVWLTIGAADAAERFQRTYFPDEPNVFFLQDPQQQIWKTFPKLDGSTPTIMIFNRSGREIAHLVGNRRAAEIAAYYK